MTGKEKKEIDDMLDEICDMIDFGDILDEQSEVLNRVYDKMDNMKIEILVMQDLIDKLKVDREIDDV